MKTIKSTILVLFVLLTAQIASAYYCPSTGRWLSRDPIGEPGFQTLQMASVVRTTQPASSRWINRDSVFGSSINERKSNSKIAYDYFAKLYLEKPYVREQLEPLANKINWDAVKITDNKSKQTEEANFYEFAIDNPISVYDFMGLDTHSDPPFQPPYRPIDVQVCFIWWHSLPVGMVLGFTPASAHCPRKEVKDCCNGAAKTFADSYLPGGLPDSQSYAIALALAQVYFQSCLTLGH